MNTSNHMNPFESVLDAMRTFAPPLETLDAAKFAEIVARALPGHLDAFNALLEKTYRAQWEALSPPVDSGGSAAAQATPTAKGQFEDPAWQDVPFFRAIKAQYLAWSAFWRALPDTLELQGEDLKLVRFVLQHWNAAASPENYLPLNPAAIRRALQTQGASLSRGAAQFARDIDRGRIAMTDPNAFELGRDLAATPGDVVFENELVQLIQYRPSTPQVYARPLLIIPPFINKYYVLDLRAENSFVRDAVSRGHTTFIVSWRNAGHAQEHMTWDDYVEAGVFAPLDVALSITQSDSANVLGFCVGGTLSACAAAIEAAHHRSRIHSLTLLATLLDFTDTGDISVFIDEAYVKRCEQRYAQGGIVRGSQLASAFASLRPRDLIWHFYEHNYLLGDTPQPFDLLFWNDDSANVPGPLFAFYLRNMYLENRLRVPRELRICQTAMDLRRINVPIYVLAAKDDHIVPWGSARRGARLFGTEPRFVLTESGHIAGVVSPPQGKRRGYWSGGTWSASDEQWLDAAQYTRGSWWDDWHGWLRPVSGALHVAPKQAGNHQFHVVEPAPGRYVLESPIIESR